MPSPTIFILQSPDLIDRVYIASRIILILAEKVSTLRAENHELKLDVGLEVMAASEKWVANLEAKVEGLNVALGDAEQCCKDLEQAK
ncbi:hypothetical protein B296_00024136 [Ensete ventricosum]|uniref:Uncharacterized protein n=1 Tax=Ensete ventricosum TaxID=4639 RepID=A0A426YPS9_ENSVE|nr:hypothetical protein B296_00024136 [Ensete ventricosum]